MDCCFYFLTKLLLNCSYVKLIECDLQYSTVTVFVIVYIKYVKHVMCIYVCVFCSHSKFYSSTSDGSLVIVINSQII
jgi:hypothetical protein